MSCFLRWIVVIVLLSGCSNVSNSERREWMKERTKIKVLATTEQVAFLVRLVGQEHVALYTLIAQTLDPHTYQVRRGDGELFAGADLVFFSALGLEHTASFLKFMDLPKAILIGDSIKAKSPQSILMIGNTADPHLWMDVSLWMMGIDVVEEALSKIQPEKAALFSQNAKKGKEQMLALHTALLKLIHKLNPSLRYLVTTHDAFQYFTKAYLATAEEQRSDGWQERCRAPEGISPESQMSLSELGLLVQYIEKHDVPILFSEYGVSKDSLNRLVDVCFEDGRRVQVAKKPLYADSQGKTGGYQEMMLQNANTLVEELYGRDEPSS